MSFGPGDWLQLWRVMGLQERSISKLSAAEVLVLEAVQVRAFWIALLEQLLSGLKGQFTRRGAILEGGWHHS